MPKCEMLINCEPGEECRIAIVEDGRLEEIYQERSSAESHVGNIYKGRVVNVEASIQAAFIDFGLERNGFLHITDLHPKYFHGQFREESERVGHKTPRRDRPPIQRCLRRGQEMLIQILKEGIGTKGPTLTSYLSIPGRFLVMMPDMQRLGVSRRFEDEDLRRDTRRLLEQLDPPDGFGFIVRTAGVGQTKTELKRDLAYLQRLWSAIEKRRKSISDAGVLYAESDLVVRTIRDVFSPAIERVVVDDPAAAQRARDYLNIANPRSSSKVMVYRDAVPLFQRFGVEDQIDDINRRTVNLPSGGSLVIEATEAVVAIDVNSGRMRENRDAETTAFRTNQEGVDEICRQLRLRDLGGVIINDLIDMTDGKHRRAIESRFRQNLKRDRARTRTASISPFGILEMTRQRMRPSLERSIHMDCPSCRGSGAVLTAESVLLDVMRRLAAILPVAEVAHVELTISPDVAFQLLNRKRRDLVALEQRYTKRVMVRVNGSGPIDFIRLQAFDGRGGEVDIDKLVLPGSPQLLAVDDLPEAEVVPDATSGSDPSVDPAATDAEAVIHVDAEGSAAAIEAVLAAEAAALNGAGIEVAAGAEADEEGRTRRRRRRRRGGRNRGKRSEEAAAQAGAPPEAGQADEQPPAAVAEAPGPQAETSPGAAVEIEEAAAAPAEVPETLPAAEPAADTPTSETPAPETPATAPAEVDSGAPRKRRSKRKRSTGQSTASKPSRPRKKAAAPKSGSRQAKAGREAEAAEGEDTVSHGYSNRVLPSQKPS